ALRRRKRSCPVHPRTLRPRPAPPNPVRSVRFVRHLDTCFFRTEDVIRDLTFGSPGVLPVNQERASHRVNYHVNQAYIAMPEASIINCPHQVTKGLLVLSGEILRKLQDGS